jgi:DedD protein
MEEKNELNDIILSKNGSNSGSKKLLLAIAALTLILIIVLVIMNSLKTQTEEKPPVVAVPPEPTAPTEIIDDPLFEPVEVIQEGAGNATVTDSQQDLGQIAQKIKQESMQNTAVQENVIQNVPTTPAVSATQTAPTKIVSKPIVESTPKPVVVNTPTIKTAMPTETKKAIEPKSTTTTKTVAAQPAKTVVKAPSEPTTKTGSIDPTIKPVEKVANTSGIYYIQVGSFTKEPNKALFDRINASGLKYTTSPSGAATKVLIGPFQGEKAARDVLGTVKRNIESGAYIVKG